MPRYRSTSPYEQTVMGLRAGVDGVTVTPATGRPALPEGSTVVVGYGDELDTPGPVAFPGALDIDPPAPTVAPAPAPSTTEETAQP